MRTLAVFAAALVLVACDSTEPEVYMAASAREATLIGIEPSTTRRAFDVLFRYVGDTPSPCYTLNGYGSSSTTPPGGRAPDEAIPVGVDVNVVDRSESECTTETGTVEAELRVPVDKAGLYVFAFERPGMAPLERRVRVSLDAAPVEEE